MMQETLCRRRCLLKIPKNYTGFKAETNDFAEHRGRTPSLTTKNVQLMTKSEVL